MTGEAETPAAEASAAPTESKEEKVVVEDASKEKPKDHLRYGIAPEKDRRWRVKHSKEETTLADVREEAKAEKRARAEGDHALYQHSRKINITNYTSEDSYVKSEKMHTYYCSICGFFALIMQDTLGDVPFRETDDSFVIREAKKHTRNVNYAGTPTNIRRAGGVEVQYRFYCKECKQPLGYRTEPEKQPCKFAYFWRNGLVPAQSQCSAFRKRRKIMEADNNSATPIVGPQLPPIPEDPASSSITAEPEVVEVKI